MAFFGRLRNILVSGDLRFALYERYSRAVGIWSISLSKILYGRRLSIASPYRVWGRIRFLIFGNGSIVIGRNFHAVSDRKRSFFTLFSPCHFTVVGEGRIVLGEHVGINGVTIVAKKHVAIGDFTMIGPNTIITDHDGHNAWPPRDRWTTGGKAADVIIEKDVWIGMNCIVLKGVTIGSGAIVAAGSVVIGNVEANSLYAGNPAKKIKMLDQQEAPSSLRGANDPSRIH